jgi:hypothetical protein
VGITAGSTEVPGRKTVVSGDNNNNYNNNSFTGFPVLLFLIQMSAFPFCCYITNLIILEPGYLCQYSDHATGWMIWFDFQQRKKIFPFSRTSRLALGPHPACCSVGAGVLTWR